MGNSSNSNNTGNSGNNNNSTPNYPTIGPADNPNAPRYEGTQWTPSKPGDSCWDSNSEFGGGSQTEQHKWSDGSFGPPTGNCWNP